MIDVDQLLRTNLTPAQAAAASDPAAEVLTLACAGSGKSRTLAYRIARLILEGVPAQSIVAFTFTEKAAESIKLQVARALSAAQLDPTILGAMYIGTIHSYCQDVLSRIDARYHQFDALDDNSLILFLISRYAPLEIVEVRRDRQSPYFDTIREVSRAWKLINDEMINLDDVEASDPVLGSALGRVKSRLDQDQFLDFSLMIRLVVDALKLNDPAALRAVGELRHLMVDEYQDVNPAQEELIRALHPGLDSLFVVGDDDQCIYAWRGADVTNIMSFDGRYPAASTHSLSHNFRSTQAIVRVADRFAAAELGAERIDKSPTADDPEGGRDFRVLWFEERTAEAEWVAEQVSQLLGTEFVERDGTVRGLTVGDFAILMRSTKGSEQSSVPRHVAFTEALTRRALAYTLEAGGGPFERPHVQALRGAFELLRHESPSRQVASDFFTEWILPAFPFADFRRFTRTLASWGRSIHTPQGGARRRVYPQQLVHDLLEAFGLAETNLEETVMKDLGLFSRIIQDVETVYLSVDSPGRFQEVLNFLSNVAESGYDVTTEDVRQRPDAVTVSTVHRMKGLEFPVVFVVDVEAQRFPVNRSPYRGWVPEVVMQPALARGAYQTSQHDEARLFYTALTRAERFLYVTGTAWLPNAKRARRRSPFALRLNDDEISENLDNGLPGQTRCAPMRRFAEDVVPTSYTDIRYYLRCPRDFQMRRVFGFSPPISDMFGFGRTTHTAITKLHEVFPEAVPTADQAESLARDTFHLKHVPPSRQPDEQPGPYEQGRDSAANIVRGYAEEFQEDFAHRRSIEVRFEIPVDQAVISGSIDLMLRRDGVGNVVEASVVDFKAMEGGEAPEENERLYWSELALQVQLYAKAAIEVLGENAKTGSVHLLKDHRRIEVPVDDAALMAAIANVEWAVARMIEGDYPMRPHTRKCGECDFKALCSKTLEGFRTATSPPPILVLGNIGECARAFSEVSDDGAG